ncbi:MAG TPA: hypothetical protein VK698_37270 [Kofleriaceae bacterium]|nr:hypothetical protein [Kofleriaceae bacterium]
MRWTSIATCAVIVMVSGSVAEAEPNYELNRIKGTMDMAETRFKAGELDSARFQMNALKDLIAQAGPETRGDPEFARVKTRYKTLDKKLAGAESTAGAAADAEQKARDGESDHIQAKINEDEDPEKAEEFAHSCMKKLSEAFKADPSLRDKELSSMTGKAIYADCKARAEKARKFNSGESKQRAAETDQGKAGIAGFDVAFEAMNDKDLDAETLVAGMEGVDQCRSAAGHLTGLLMSGRNRKPYYDADKEMITTAAGKISLNDFSTRCQEMQVELSKKKAKGCGTKHVSVQQELIGRRRWSEVTRWGANLYKVVSCKEVPKKSKFPGSSKKYAGKLKSVCGKKAVFLMDDSSWRTWDSNGKVYRSISGTCYDKGALNFGTTAAIVQY